MTTIAVFVPTPGTAIRAVIDPGSGIVGTHKAGRVEIDYEGNRYGASNLVTYADRVKYAHGRHVAHYPTVARSYVRRDELIYVGSFDPDTGTVTVANVDALSDWLDGVESSDLQTTS